MNLSPEQREAACLLEGAVRVVAGAGTGKTAVIAERYRTLTAAGASPEAILVMTFTDRAAREMRSRIEQATGQPAPAVGTFHSLAMGWLREDGGSIGLRPSFRILNGADRWIALRELMWEMGDPALVADDRPDDLVNPLLKVMERLKQELVPLGRLEEWCAANAGDERSSLLGAAARLFREHARRTRAAGLLDFDDLLLEASRLLEEQPGIAARYRARYRHLMVDEYQDTNLAQERLVELLGRGAESVFVVGDDDQSIYRFRGAALASMNRFLRVFPKARTVTLGVNRRSTRSIVESAAALIGQNEGRIEKDLRASGPRGGPVIRLRAVDGGAEASAIAFAAVSLHERGTEWSEIAVLCRTHAVARPIVEALRNLGVPHRQLGAGGIYDVPEVRDVIALLRLLRDPSDLVSLARCLARPPLEVEIGEALAHVRQVVPPASSHLEALTTWRPVAAWAHQVLDVGQMVASAGVGDLFFELMSRTQLLELHARDPRAVAAVTRFGELIDEFCASSPDQSLAAWLTRLDLLLLSGYDEEVGGAGIGDEDAVRVMTIHQAKGLEFNAVLVPSVVEGRMPQPARRTGFELPSAILEPAVRRREDNVAEERRLAYVALTRARRHAVLSFAATYDGTRMWQPSRFLAELEAGGRLRDEEAAAPAAPDETSDGRRVTMQPGEASGEQEEHLLSFSSLAAYRECPAQHRYRYRLRLPVAETAEGQYGTVVHAALMRAGRQRRDAGSVSPDEAAHLVEAEWARVEPVDERRLPALRRLSTEQVRRFVEAGGFAAAPDRVEERFTTTIDGWELRGIIDRIDGPQNPPPSQEGGGWAPGGWRIVDYKTGNPLPASRLRRDLQLALYALGAKQELGLDPIELEIVYLKTGKRVVLPATEELLDEARRLAGEVVEGIRAGNFDPRPERRRCALCPYRLACPAAL